MRFQMNHPNSNVTLFPKYFCFFSILISEFQWVCTGFNLQEQKDKAPLDMSMTDTLLDRLRMKGGSKLSYAVLCPQPACRWAGQADIERLFYL